MENKEHIDIFNNIILEIEQYSIEKKNLGNEIFVNLYNEWKKKTTNQIEKIFIKGNKYIFLLCRNVNEPLFLLFLDEYIGHDIEYVCEEIKYDGDKNFFGPKMIYYIVWFIVQHFTGWNNSLNYYLYTIEESFNFNRLIEIINHVILNHYSNSKSDDFLRMGGYKKIDEFYNFYNYLTLTNIDSLKYPKLYFNLIETYNLICDDNQKNKMDENKMDNNLQNHIYDKSNIEDMKKIKINKKFFQINYTVIK